MATNPTQRSYRAPCPGCGAPVEFKSAQSSHAVCGYCQSTVLRQGEVLQRIGKMAELFDDHSPLQLMASGRVKLADKELAFTLIGRLQYHSDAGRWTEWSAYLEDGRLATLGEDNGAYVFTLALPPGTQLPDVTRLPVGSTSTINGQPYSVTFNGQVQLLAAQGELPKLAPLGQPFTLVELRSGDGQVLSIDYGSSPVQAEAGRSVLLEELQMQGLKGESAKDEQGRQFNCPHCGAPVQVQLESTKSCTCPACRSIIDLSQGMGAQLLSALQDEPVRPLIALGSKGQLQGVHWQVVGFQHRMGQEPGDDESFGWDEYLLYNQKRGFAFLVDASDGWSLARPTTGAPQMASNGASASYLGQAYRLQYSYNAVTTYVLGEFYWPVERGQKTFNRDFASAKGLLSMEQSAHELTWSSGDKISADSVIQAFGLESKRAAMQRADVGPFTAQAGQLRTWMIVLVVLIILLMLLSDCSGGSSSSGSYSRSSGGSWGGYSSGGSHK